MEKVVASQDDATVFSKKYKIHEGEAASILLAIQLDADLLLINLIFRKYILKTNLFLKH